MRRRLYGLDLFSGIGGNTLGLQDYIKTIAYCEQDRHAQSVLLSRMGCGDIAPAPIWDDITTLTREAIDIPIDIIIGGFPCQDISAAGKGAGLEGERSGLFFEVIRLAKELKPTFLFLENVPRIRTNGLDTIIQELTRAGYDCRWTMLSAADVGAPQVRKRWFLLAHSHDGNGLQPAGVPGTDGPQVRFQEPRQDATNQSSYAIGWSPEPNVLRVDNGVPLRVERIKRIGNAVVPEQAKKAFEMLLGIAEIK